MNFKNFILAGIAGGITDFLLGYLFYGILFHTYFGSMEPNLKFIFLGCMSFGFLISYIYVRYANLVTFMAGLKGGAVIGLLTGLMYNFFNLEAMGAVVDYQKFAVDVALTIVLGAGVGAVTAAVNGALSKTTTKQKFS